MEKKKIIRPVVILLILALAGGGWWYTHREQGNATDTLVLYGNVDIREVDLAFNNSEHIDRILVQEGDRVRKGQLLATMHNERMAAELAAAKARVATQKAVVERLENGTRPEDIRKARADVAAAQARVVDAERTYQRTLRLYKNKAASKQAVDDAEAALHTARADLKVAEEALALAV
ncbi:MAG TPA: biotin/lipoyl-binding protein, partial [Gammaproteobacteria bacterium]|nr:biotin/lipoyl-binding protein [Gammaproteobacteria bacterium]